MRGHCMGPIQHVWVRSTFHKWTKLAVIAPVHAHSTHRHCTEVGTHTVDASVSYFHPPQMLHTTTLSLSGNPYMLYGTHTVHAHADAL